MIVAHTQLPENITGDWLKCLCDLIPAGLLKTINLRKSPAPLARSLAGRYLLKEILKAAGLNFQHFSIQLDCYKRPFIVGSSWKFSILHSHRLVVCAFTREGEVGIDIEKISAIAAEDFVTQFTAIQFKEVMDPVTYPHTFFKLWTAKESVSKATGKGLHANFKQINFSDSGDCMLDDRLWHTQELSIAPGYCCTLASDISRPEIILRRLEL